jgi:hypothetical protein
MLCLQLLALRSGGFQLFLDFCFLRLFHKCDLILDEAMSSNAQLTDGGPSVAPGFLNGVPGPPFGGAPGWALVVLCSPTNLVSKRVFTSPCQCDSVHPSRPLAPIRVNQANGVNHAKAGPPSVI